MPNLDHPPDISGVVRRLLQGVACQVQRTKDSQRREVVRQCYQLAIFMATGARFQAFYFFAERRNLNRLGHSHVKVQARLSQG